MNREPSNKTPENGAFVRRRLTLEDRMLSLHKKIWNSQLLSRHTSEVGNPVYSTSTDPSESEGERAFDTDNEIEQGYFKDHLDNMPIDAEGSISAFLDRSKTMEDLDEVEAGIKALELTVIDILEKSPEQRAA